MNYKQFVNWKARSFKDPFVKLERDFCEILEGLRQDFTRGFCSTHEFSPAVDVFETDSQVQIVVELPGLTAADVSVEAQEMALIISGEKPQASEAQLYRESQSGSFRRIVPLDFPISNEQVDCSMKHGVLRIVVSKEESAKETGIKLEIKPS